METLCTLDKELLLVINGAHTPLMDRFFWIFTSIAVWIPLYAFIGYQFIKPNYKSGLILVAGLALTFAISDQISSALLKNLFERLRPSHEPSLEGLVRILNEYRGGNFGFVSGHAANSFALATFVSYFLRNRWLTVILFLWAVINSYSRVYLGVHYPGDVLCGGMVGVAVAYSVIYILNLLETKYLFFRENGSHSDLFKNNYKISYLPVIFAIGAMVLTIFFSSLAMVKFI